MVARGELLSLQVPDVRVCSCFGLLTELDVVSGMQMMKMTSAVLLMQQITAHTWMPDCHVVLLSYRCWERHW